jgi:hypothetical protein
MDKANAEAQYDGLRKLLAERLKHLDSARREQVKTKIAFEREQDAFGKAIRDLKMTYAQDPAIQHQPDPSTGKPNKEWSGWLIERAVEKDPEYITSTGTFYAVQEAYFASEVALHQAGEEVAATKAEMLLLAALMKYLSSPE